MSGPLVITRRRALATIGTLLSAGAGSGACARSRDRQTLRVAYAPVTFSKLYESIAAAFMRAHPDLRIKLMPAPSSAGTMPRDFTLALVNDEPDVSHVGLNHVRFYAERNLAVPLDRYIAGDPQPLTTHPAIGRIAGETRALPFAVSVPVNYMNDELLRRAGHDPQAFAAGGWPALLNAATDMSAQGRLAQNRPAQNRPAQNRPAQNRPALSGPVSGMFFDYASGQALTWQMLVYGYGGHMMSADERTIAFGDQPGLRSAQLLEAIGRTGQVDMSRENARMAFAAGLLGCYTNTSSNMDRFSAANMGFPVTMLPLPIEPGVGRLPAAGNAVVITTRQRSRQDAAWQYVRFATGPIGQTIMASQSGYLTLNRVPLDDPDLLQPYLASRPQYRALYSMVDTLDQWYAFPGSRSEQIAKAIGSRMRSVLIRRASPEAALADMVREAQRLIDWR
jgi:multiple sugar transport system substrate-binding protein